MKKVMLLLFSLATMNHAMDFEQVPAQKSITIIRGILILYPHEEITYSPYLQKDIKKDLGLEMNASDPLVPVRALESDGWAQRLIFLPKKFDTFTEFLPLSVLRDKKDGDELTFMNGEETKIILTCNQKVQSVHATFISQLKYAINEFKNKPTWHLFDKKELIKQGIIVKVAKGQYKHGPNGYKFENSKN